MKRERGAERGVVGLLALGLAMAPLSASAEVRAQRDRWQGNEGECLTLANDPVKAENIRRLALVLLGKSDASVGCVTFPYLGTPYGVAGNTVHAGIDLRANNVTVLAADAGTVRKVSFCDPDKQSDCDPKSGSSTLIIESNDRTRKTVYLHMSSIDVKQGSYVQAGQPVGTAGSVGADSAHLHFEVWPARSPLYCARQRSISGSACADANSTCSLDRIQQYTIDPESVVQYPDNTAPPKRTTPSVSSANPVTLSGVGPVKVGASLWDSLQGLEELALGDDSAECSMVKLQSAECGLSVMLQQGRVARVDVDQGQYRTAEGFGIGTTEAELRKFYGARLKSEPNKYTEGVLDMSVDGTVNGQRRSVLFVVAGGKVENFRAGEAAAVGLVEHCL